jgi:hypothetical protein
MPEQQRVRRVHVWPRRRRELIALGHADDHVALELLCLRIFLAERVAHEAHALREVGVLHPPPQVMRQLLGDLVLVAFAALIGERQVVGVGAYAQHVLARGLRLALTKG